MRTASSFPVLARWPRRTLAVFVSVGTISSFIGLVGPMGVPAASATGETCAPQIASVSAVMAAQAQTIKITGTCFGTANQTYNNPTYGIDSGNFAISDVDTQGRGAWWQGCFQNNQFGPNQVTCDITNWSDTSITFSGFTGSYGQSDWVLTTGDAVVISVWNADTIVSGNPGGPANCIVTVGGGATDCAQASLPLAPSTTTVSALSGPSITVGGSVTDTAIVSGQTLTGTQTTNASGDPLAGIPTGTVNFYVCGPFPSPQLCTSTSSQVGSENGYSLNSSSPGSDDFATATSSSFSPQVAGIYCFASVYGGGSNANDTAIYQPSADNNSGTVDPNQCVNVTGAGSATNTSWPTAQTLTSAVSTMGTIADSGESLWYDFAVQPDEQVQVSLTNVPADYNVLVFSDIGAAFQAATSSTPNLAAIGAQSPGGDSSYNQISPLGVSPLGVSPLGVSPLGISPLGVSPLGVSPLGVSPLGVSSGALNPANFNPALTPAELTDAYSGAEVDSLLAVSSASGAVDKSVTVDTWNNTGNFYVAITGNNGASSPNSFTLGVSITGGPCAGVPLNTYSGDSTLSGSGTDGTDHTVIVDNSALMSAVAQGGSLYTPLQLLASETGGTVVDVNGSQKVTDLEAQAQKYPGCPYAEDLVADAIQDIINSYRGANGGANLNYVVIVGDDHVIPFFRYPDNAGLGAESSYEPPLSSTSPANAALQTPDYLSDDQYGAASVLDIQGTTVPLQTAAVGRLVENPSDILSTIESYLTVPDGGLGHHAINPSSTLATGYSFMQPPATQVAAAFAQGVTPGSNSVLISAENAAPSASWTASDLSTALFNSGHHDLVFLGGHFSANALEAADDTTTITTNQFASSVGTTLADSLVLSAGCHSGYAIDPADGVPDVTDTLSWPQAFAEAGATLIAGTGYQYGDTNYVAYSDQVYVDLANQLGYQPSAGPGRVAVGTALLGAEQQYLSTLDKLNGIEEKALLQVTLYGLPMLGVQEPSQTPTSPNASVIGSTSPEVAGPGAQLDLQHADLDLGSLSPTTQSVKPPGSSTIYSYDSGPQGVTADPSSPVLPVLTDNVNSASGTLRGVGFRSGSYSDSTVSNPLTGDPVTDTANPEVTPFTSPVFFPQTMWNPNYFSTLLNGAGSTNLTFTPVQYESTSGTSADLRTYSDLDVRLFYSNNTSTFGGNTPALAAAPTISYVTSTTTGDVVNVSATVTGDPSAGVQDVWVTYTGTGDQPGTPLYGSWQSVDLTQSSTNSTLWTGSFPDTGSANPARDSVFMVQAVNGVGEVSMDDNGGYYFTPTFTPGAPLTNANTYSLTFGPNAGGQYMGTATVSAQLQQTSGAGDITGQTITFGIGDASTTAITGSDGTASLNIPVTLPPGNYTFTAYYAGDGNDAPAGAQETFTVNQASTALALSPPGQLTSGSNNGFSATLTSGGSPLSQKTVYFEVSSGGTALLSVAAITNNSGIAQTGAITLPPGDVGTDTVTAYFGSAAVPLASGLTYNASDPDYSESDSSGPLTMQDATQTALVAAPGSSVYGQSVTLTATVTAAGSSGTVSPQDGQGTVAFSQGGSSIAACQTQPLLSGQATCTLSGLPPSQYGFSATYSGSTGNYLTSTSANAPLTVGMASTSTALTGNRTTVSGQSVTFTATVTPVSPGSGTPTGTVAFMETPSGGHQAPLTGCTAQPLDANSSAKCTTTALLAQGSSYSISAQYSGDNNFSGSPATGVPQTVNEASTTTTVISKTGSPSVAGQAVTYTATVAVGGPGTGNPTGNVEFLDAGTAIAACGGTAGTALIGAKWTCTVTTYSSTGTHTITALYLGDPNYSASLVSPSISQVVSADPTTVLLTSTSGASSSTSTPGSSVTGQSITYSAAVSANPPGSGTPLGTVTFTYTPSGHQAVTMCAGVTLVSGNASCGDGAVLVEASSPYTITATYQPSTSPTSFAGSNATVIETVSAASTKTQLTAPASSNFGSSVSLKVTVTALAPGYGTPAGSVTFSDGNAVVGTATLANGTATFVVTGLQGGTQSFTASYGGNPNFAPSSSGTATDVVGFTQTISLTYSGSLSIKSGQLVLVTGTVTGSVSVATGGALEVNGGSIGGAVAASGALAFTLCHAKVGGSMSVSSSTGFVFIGGSVPAGTGCAGSSIAGAMSLSNNKGGLEIATSTVSGAASITGNSGSGPVEQKGAYPPPEVAGNTISGALACSGNTPSLTDAGMSNKAPNKSGQCDVPTTF